MGLGKDSKKRRPVSGIRGGCAAVQSAERRAQGIEHGACGAKRSPVPEVGRA